MRRPGFTIPGYAASAGRKAHELGAAHQWTPEEAKEAARKAAEQRTKRTADPAAAVRERHAYAV
jgi:hypothetical protein